MSVKVRTYGLFQCECMRFSMGDGMHNFGCEQQRASLTCEDAVDALHHQICVLHAKTHGRFKFQDAFEGAVRTDADFILHF